MATEEKKNDGRTVMLNGVTLSFTSTLQEAKPTVEGGKPKHTANVLVQPDSKNYEANKAKIVSAIKAACVQEFGEGKGEFFKVISEDNPMRVAYRSGARFKNNEGEIYKGYEGAMVIAGAGPGAGARRPALFDRRKGKLGEKFTIEQIPDIFYSGTLADVKVSFYGVSGKEKGGNGVFATLEAVRSYEEGDRMGGGAVATNADEFDDLDSDTGGAGDDDFG